MDVRLHELLAPKRTGCYRPIPDGQAATAEDRVGSTWRFWLAADVGLRSAWAGYAGRRAGRLALSRGRLDPALSSSHHLRPMSSRLPTTGPPVVGIDFGTTNSVVAVLQPDGAVRTTRAPGLEVFRTELCFWAERGALRHSARPHAVAAYLDDPEDTRLIMSMKTYLAQGSFSSTRVMGRRFTLKVLVALFLRGLLAEQDMDSARIVAGRPVRFAGDLADDALGEARLRASFRQAGLGEVEVAYEPEAAASASSHSTTASRSPTRQHKAPPDHGVTQFPA